MCDSVTYQPLHMIEMLSVKWMNIIIIMTMNRETYPCKTKVKKISSSVHIWFISVLKTEDAYWLWNPLAYLSLLVLLIITFWCISFTFLWLERFLTVFYIFISIQWIYLVKPQLCYNHSIPFFIKSTLKQTAYSLKFAPEKAHLMIFLVVHLFPWYL